MEGRWGGYKITTINSKGQSFEIESVEGIRGMNIPVTVTLDNGNWSVIHKGRPVSIKGVTKVTAVGLVSPEDHLFDRAMAEYLHHGPNARQLE